MLLRDVIELASEKAESDRDPSFNPVTHRRIYGMAFADGVKWVLGLLAECDDIEDEGLEDYV